VPLPQVLSLQPLLQPLLDLAASTKQQREVRLIAILKFQSSFVTALRNSLSDVNVRRAALAAASGNHPVQLIELR
jgi:hypothetical protein